MKSTVKKITHGDYEVSANGRVFRVIREWEGELKGLWVVKEQDANLKAKGVNHWFRKGVEASKRDAIRLIEDGGYYAN